MQESDLLDLLPDGEAKANSGTEHIKLVSLGCFCGPKLSFKHIGRGAVTLPFDWMRTRSCGLLKFMRQDFDGFFDFVKKIPVPGASMTTYRGYYHSFYHDDPSCPGMRERYERRIVRFKALESSEDPILFVRTIPSTNELDEVPELYTEIVTRYGKHACLLLIIDFQWTATGPAMVDGYPNLMVYYLTGSHHVGEDGTPTPPYCEPVLMALDWMVGRPIEAMRFPDMGKIKACADETHWGLEGLGGLTAFEPTLDCSPDEPLEVLPAGAAPAVPLPLPSQELEQMAGGRPQAPGQDGITIVSLGCSPATKMTLQAMGRSMQALPFDWTRVSHDGLLHFLHRGMDAPVREGLGAGTQRPTEKLGFLDCATRRPVPGSTLTLCRSHLHSFWHDDVGDPAARARLSERILNWNMLGKKGEPLLFVRAVATTSELARADELLSALARRYGPQSALLLIVDFQEANSGAYVVDGIDDMLVYFQKGSAHQGQSAAAPYFKAVQCALDWMNGEPLEASCIADLAALGSLAAPTNWGLVGPGGLHAFEGLGRPAPQGGGDGQSASRAALAEIAWLEFAKLEAAKDSFALVSLGCCPAVAQAIDLLGHGAEESPFDGIHIRLDGVVRFLLTDFREFFDVSSCEPLPGTGLSVRKSSVHMFCDGFPADSWTKAYQQVIDQFSQLARSARPKLFVYALASSDELGGVFMLHQELMAYFGAGIYLVALLGGQTESRVISVEGTDNVLIHFLVELVGTAVDAKPLCRPITQSLDWAAGKPTKASVATDMSAVRGLAKAFTATLQSPDGLSAFAEVAVDGASVQGRSIGSSTASSAASLLTGDFKAGDLKFSARAEAVAEAQQHRSPVGRALGELFNFS